MSRLCQVLGCDRKHVARGMCGPHYAQWRRGVRAGLVLPYERHGEPAQAPARSRLVTTGARTPDDGVTAVTTTRRGSSP